MRPWKRVAGNRIAGNRAGGRLAVLAASAALVAAGCGPNIENDLPPAPTVTTSASAAVPTPSASASLPPGDRAYLAQLAATLPGLRADDNWKIDQATWTCLELDEGMTLRGAAITSALVSDDRLTVATATTLARAAVPNYCPRHVADLAFDGDAPLDRTLDGDGQGACFWLDYAQELSNGGKRVGNIDLAYAVFAAGQMAKQSAPPDFRADWLGMTSDISTPQGLAEREALCARHGWTGGTSGALAGTGGGTGGVTPTPDSGAGQPA
jgi:Protein of unknown function (DUF732)